jgi:hypothetical protein
VIIWKRLSVSLASVAFLTATYFALPFFAAVCSFVLTDFTERGLLTAKDETIGLIETATQVKPSDRDGPDLSNTKLGALAGLDELDQFLWRDARFENIDYIFEQEGREEALAPLSQKTSNGTVPASNWYATRTKGSCSRHYNIQAWRDPSKTALQVSGSVWEDCSKPSVGPVPQIGPPKKQ